MKSDPASSSASAIRPLDLELWAVFCDGVFYAAYPRKILAEAYASGFSKPTRVERLRSSVAAKEPCKCGVAAGISHYCSALDHCWIGKREPPNPHREHLAPNGKPIDGYPEQQA